MIKFWSDVIGSISVILPSTILKLAGEFIHALAVTTKIPEKMPMIAPAFSINAGRNRPSSNERTVPDTAPTAKRMAVPFTQRLLSLR